MYHLRVPVFLLVVLVLLRCIAAAPSHRNFSPGSSDDEEENALPAKEGLTGARLQRRLAAPNSKKPVCHTTTCLANSLADLMGHKGKGKGDVGPDSYGKRDIQPPGYLPFYFIRLKSSGISPVITCRVGIGESRNFSPGSSDDKQENALPAKEGLTGARLQRRLTAPNRHRLQKRTCNSSTCFTQKLGEMLMNNVRGTPKTPMNVGPKSFGKRDI
ncbi:uncharacterized protein LOC106942519 [Poecilia latipinna]|uniref:uncharacterized protein LOC106942519 n=1 Tax=Poecilia latipinna TaxID=48699 RepID=UPI00072EEA81|nr:PREDICTED: uncharacterized protein LOC106942519 [Poecilia latipinna]